MNVKRRRGARIGAGVVFAAMLAGVTPLAAADTTRSPSIAWQACGTSGTAARARCGTVRVPVDWSRPAAGSLDLAVLRYPAAGPAVDRTLVVDSPEPGGLGGSEIDFFLDGDHAQQLMSRMPTAAAADDLIVFDARGTGRSTPITCPIPATEPAVPLHPDDRRGYADLVAHNRAFGAACLAATGPLLAHLDSARLGRDAAAIRAARGAARLSWFGQSYGARIGAMYAASYPRRVDRMVLDSVPDRSRPTPARLTEVAAAEERAFDRYAAWCGTTRCAGDDSPDIPRLFDSAVALAAHGDLAGPGRPLTPDDLRLGMSHLLLGERLIFWPQLGTAIARAARGQADLFSDIASIERTDPDYTGYRAISCLDYPWRPDSYPEFAELQHRLQQISPHLGGESVWWEAAAGCIGWPVPAPAPPRPTPRTGPTSTLVISNRYDPTIPYRWSVDYAAGAVDRRLLTTDGTGHPALDTSACVQHAVDAYLTAATLPPAGSVCDPGAP